MNREGEASRPVAVLVAFGIGESELRCCLASLHDHGLLGHLLLVCAPGTLRRTAYASFDRLEDDFGDARFLAERIEVWCRKRDTVVSAVVGIDEELHFGLSRRLAAHFGVPFHDEVSCALASNKYLAKRELAAQGVPTAPFGLLSELDAAVVERVGYPNVLKTMSGTQSQFLVRNESAADVARNLARLREALAEVRADPRFDVLDVTVDGERLSLDPRRQFLLEAYVPGTEMSCDFMARDGEVRLIRVTKKLAGAALGIFGGYLLLDEATTAAEGVSVEALTEMCRGIARAFRVRDAVCMVDFKLGDRGPVVLESSLRPGFSAFNHLMFEVYGYTSLALMVAEAMGRPIPLREPAGTGAVVYLVAPENEARPLRTARLKQHSSDLGIAAIHVFDDDTVASEFDPSPRLRGYAVLRNFPADQLEARIAAIHDSVDYG